MKVFFLPYLATSALRSSLEQLWLRHDFYMTRKSARNKVLIIIYFLFDVVPLSVKFVSAFFQLLHMSCAVDFNLFQVRVVPSIELDALLRCCASLLFPIMPNINSEITSKFENLNVLNLHTFEIVFNRITNGSSNSPTDHQEITSTNTETLTTWTSIKNNLRNSGKKAVLSESPQPALRNKKLPWMSEQISSTMRIILLSVIMFCSWKKSIYSITSIIQLTGRGFISKRFYYNL